MSSPPALFIGWEIAIATLIISIGPLVSTYYFYYTVIHLCLVVTFFETLDNYGMFQYMQAKRREARWGDKLVSKKRPVYEKKKSSIKNRVRKMSWRSNKKEDQGFIINETAV